MKQETFEHKFVIFIPDVLQDGRIYVSMEYATVVHRCACGCGKEVVTPLGPTDWKIIFNGRAISLDPSIGNWSFPCRSHYWIRNNRVQWAEQWSQERIDANRLHDQSAKDRYYGVDQTSAQSQQPTQPKPATTKTAWWKKVWPW